MKLGRSGRIVLGAFAVLVAATAAATVARPASVPLADVTVRTIEGERIALQSLLARGPVLLDFWATWCRPCERSLPGTQLLHERFAGRGLGVVGVSVDGPRNWARVRPFTAKLGLTFPIVVDEDGSLARRFRANGVPTTVLIAPDGRIVRFRTGWTPSEDDSLAAEVASLLADVPPAP